MSQNSNKGAIAIATATVLGLLVAKAFWVGLDYLYLPKSGVEVEKGSGIKKLYYHYNLASTKPKPVVKNINKNNKPAPKPKEPEKITKFVLKGLYNSKAKKVIIVIYNAKSYALSLGEELEGYKFVQLKSRSAIFKKDGKDYKIELKKKPVARTQKSSSSNYRAPVTTKPQKVKVVKNEPVREGDTTVIPKTLFNKYKGDFRAIRRNVNAVPYMSNGKLSGFKISFVRRGSDFSKLGLKRGDIITAINGEPLDNFKVPLEFFNNIDSLTAATFTIKRGNEIKELEYEVR